MDSTGIAMNNTQITTPLPRKEALEEWAKILTVSKIFGGPKYVLDNST